VELLASGDGWVGDEVLPLTASVGEGWVAAAELESED